MFAIVLSCPLEVRLFFFVAFIFGLLFKKGKKRVSTTWLTSAQILAIISVILSIFFVFDPSIFGLMDYILLGLDPLTWLYLMTAIVYLLLIVDYYLY